MMATTTHRAGVVTGADLRVHFARSVAPAVPACGADLGAKVTVAPMAVTCSACLAGSFLAGAAR